MTTPRKPRKSTDKPDPGVTDKRLLVVEGEFSSPLRMLGRDGNILSATLRSAWDSGNLRVMSRNEPLRSTGAHVSVIGHIGADELRRELNTTDAGNGFGNRLLIACVRRSRFLPDGGQLEAADLHPLTTRLGRALKYAISMGETMGKLERDDEARQLWHRVYPTLSEGKPGLVGAMTARAEAQVMRLAGIYALLDESAVIRATHLTAALAVWTYCEQSVRFIFRNAVGDPLADRLLDALREHSQGLTRTEIRDLLSRHGTPEVVDRALGMLLEQGLARHEKESTDGRPIERWIAISPDRTLVPNATTVEPES